MRLGSTSRYHVKEVLKNPTKWYIPVAAAFYLGLGYCFLQICSNNNHSSISLWGGGRASTSTVAPQTRLVFTTIFSGAARAPLLLVEAHCYFFSPLFCCCCSWHLRAFSAIKPEKLRDYWLLSPLWSLRTSRVLVLLVCTLAEQENQVERQSMNDSKIEPFFQKRNPNGIAFFKMQFSIIVGLFITLLFFKRYYRMTSRESDFGGIVTCHKPLFGSWGTKPGWFQSCIRPLAFPKHAVEVGSCNNRKK